MKKVLLLAITSVFVFSITQAQITKGSVLLGGNIGFSNSKNAYGMYKQNTVNVNPSIGIAVKNNVVAGISVSYSHVKHVSDSIATPQNITTKGGAVFLRRYFPVAKNFYAYGEGSLGYSQYHSRQESSDFFEDIKTNNVGLSIAPGLAYALSKKFHLELGLSNLLNVNYGTNKMSTWSTWGTSKDVKGHSFSLNTSLSTAASLYIGFRFFLSK